MHKSVNQFSVFYSSKFSSSLTTPIIQWHLQRVEIAKKKLFKQSKFQNSNYKEKRCFASQADLKQAESIPTSLEQGGQGKMLRAKPMRLNISLTSAGTVADPWIPIRPSIFQFKAFLQYLGRLSASQRDFYTIKRQLTTYRETFTKKKVVEEAINLFKEINEALAQGNIDKLRYFSTEYYASTLKNNMFTEKNLRAEWKGEIVKATALNFRALKFPKITKQFAQVTVQIDSKQAVTVHDNKGNLIAGNPEMQSLTEYWVLERAFGKDVKSHWRVCGKIPNPKIA